MHFNVKKLDVENLKASSIIKTYSHILTIKIGFINDRNLVKTQLCILR